MKGVARSAIPLRSSAEGRNNGPKAGWRR